MINKQHKYLFLVEPWFCKCVVTRMLVQYDEGVGIDDLIFALLGGAGAGEVDVLLNNVVQHWPAADGRHHFGVSSCPVVVLIDDLFVRTADLVDALSNANLNSEIR